MSDDLREAAFSAGPLLLRPWCRDDIPALVEAYRDPTMLDRLRDLITDEADAERWLRVQTEGRESGTRFSFAVVDTDLEGRPVGNVALKYPAPGSGSAEVGYWTAARARGRGLAPQAVEALTGWAFTTFADDGLRRLDLLHQVDNHASCRVAVKSGYTLAEILPARPPWPLDGHRHVREADRGLSEPAVSRRTAGRPVLRPDRRAGSAGTAGDHATDR
ncbi:GNAT family N-acetyltransferase [Streptomyces sp. NPDC058107]|uniref:GNAT family N-acetyltransferase n=1 Tax=Streptomyces sp. NPDC058107 TaxID=3346343 RepID=UPI0036E777C0